MDPGASCLSENDVLSLLRGTLDGDARSAAQSHVDRCAACQDVLAAFLKTASPVLVPGAHGTGVLAPGAVVGRYRIREEIGAGAMGIVYLADDADLHRKVALKMLQGQAAQTSERLHREAQALARLSHPNVIVVYEVGSYEGQVFMAMEFVDGSSLTTWLAQRRRGEGDIIEKFVQAGRGLAVAHAAGLVHRDFKPDNVLVGHDGRVRVVDFGLAREDVVVAAAAAGPREEPRDPISTRMALKSLTRTGAFVGTPAYMAPEQFEGKAADARTDQFGFCVALFEALYHERPFDADSIEALARAVRHGDVRVPRGQKVPRAIERAVLKGLSVRPDARYASMEELLSELAKPSPRARRAPALVGAGLLLAGVAAAVMIASTRAGQAPTATTATASAEPGALASVASAAVGTGPREPSASSARATEPEPASSKASAEPRPTTPRARKGAAVAPPSAAAASGPLMPTIP